MSLSLVSARVTSGHRVGSVHVSPAWCDPVCPVPPHTPHLHGTIPCLQVVQCVPAEWRGSVCMRRVCVPILCVCVCVWQWCVCWCVAATRLTLPCVCVLVVFG